MRQASLKIVRQENSSSVFWSIYVPAYLNPSGKAGKMYFSTRAEAESKRWELLAATRTESKITELSNPQIRDAQRALERLAEAGLTISLDRAIELALPVLRSAGSNITIAQLFAEFAELKASEWSEHSRKNFKYASAAFNIQFSTRLLSSVTGREIRAWLTSQYNTPGTQANVMRTLRPAFSYAVRQEYISFSPFSKMELPRVRKKNAIDIFTPDEARRLMETAPEDCRAAYAMLLFAGVRPTELTRLTWSCVRDGFIHITPAVAKTAQVRNIEIEPNLAAWLAASGPHAPSERICPPWWKHKNQLTRREAGLSNRPDTARHSYATYYLATHQNADALKANLGHSRGSDILFMHYRAAATPKDAERYWSILPSPVSANHG
ncbi:MAG: tyrosine-type recombinase/integrase [Akkermansia sp.]|nr:tyrosine-type recombinase/integrase [Akkermansia sp.]